MQSRSLADLARICGGELRGGGAETRVSRIGIDSRKIAAGDVFVALRGERFDGHDFLTEVGRNNAAAVVIQRTHQPLPQLSSAIIAVDDTRVALAALAADARRGFGGPVVAVAGSNGKTTTKELIASVLRERGPVLASPASFNNDIGVPLTLLDLAADHWAGVLEVGTNHPGELAPLVRLAAPRIGVITSIGREHLEFFHDLAGVADEEGALAEGLPSDGRLILHADPESTARIVRRTRAAVSRIGATADCAWRLSAVRTTAQGVTFHLEAPDPAWTGGYDVGLFGRHQATNAALAIAVGAELGLDAATIRRGLAACRGPKMRLQLHRTDRLQVLDDTYNANADSMGAALETLGELPAGGRRVAVLGDMAELGEHSAGAHEEVGRLAASRDIGLLITVGPKARGIADAATAGGLRAVVPLAGVAEAVERVPALLAPGDLVLLKASRSVGLERLVSVLLENRNP